MVSDGASFGWSILDLRPCGLLPSAQKGIILWIGFGANGILQRQHSIGVLASLNFDQWAKMPYVIPCNACIVFAMDTLLTWYLFIAM